MAATFFNNRVTAGKYLDPTRALREELGGLQGRISKEQAIELANKRRAEDQARQDSRWAVQDDRYANEQKIAAERRLQADVVTGFNMNNKLTQQDLSQQKYEAGIERENMFKATEVQRDLEQRNAQAYANEHGTMDGYKQLQSTVDMNNWYEGDDGFASVIGVSDVQKGKLSKLKMQAERMRISNAGKQNQVLNNSMRKAEDERDYYRKMNTSIEVPADPNARRQVNEFLGNPDLMPEVVQTAYSAANPTAEQIQVIKEYETNVQPKLERMANEAYATRIGTEQEKLQQFTSDGTLANNSFADKQRFLMGVSSEVNTKTEAKALQARYDDINKAKSAYITKNGAVGSTGTGKKRTADQVVKDYIAINKSGSGKALKEVTPYQKKVVSELARYGDAAAITKVMGDYYKGAKEGSWFFNVGSEGEDKSLDIKTLQQAVTTEMGSRGTNTNDAMIKSFDDRLLGIKSMMNGGTKVSKKVNDMQTSVGDSITGMQKNMYKMSSESSKTDEVSGKGVSTQLLELPVHRDTRESIRKKIASQYKQGNIDIEEYKRLIRQSKALTY